MNKIGIMLRRHADILRIIFLIMIGYLLLHDLAGGTLFLHEPLDSYTLQALAWRKGEVCLTNGQDYPWLELAIYNGKYYVSFPPLPSVLMLPLTMVFGEDTPNTLMVAIYAIAALVGAYRACLAAKMQGKAAAFWALFAVFSCNMVEISTNGGVWLQAQTLNFAFLMWAIDCILRERRSLCCMFLVLAVGCRPFSAIYIPLALLYFVMKDRDQYGSITDSRFLKKYALPAIVVMTGAAVYMWYNWIRFDNVFEFGHNYLPEFTQAENGQFHISYLLNNLRNIFLRQVKILPSGKLEYPQFDGFAFYVVNPIFIAWFVQIFKDIKNRKISALQIGTCIAILLNLLALCMHKTFGGWQFGARYTIDLIPFVLFYFILSGREKPTGLERLLCGFGILFNSYGTVRMRLLY